MSLFSSTTSSAPAIFNQNPPNGSNPSSLVQISLDQVKESVPTHMRASITQSLVDTLNNISNDPLICENIRNNFVSYTAILKEGKFKIEDYLNAVAYVSYKAMGNTNKEAYEKTFPHRFHQLIARGATDKDISSYVSAYSKGKLVNMILEQTLIPVWLLNQEVYQKAINTQADLMVNATSEKVRCDAANSILTHLGKPKEATLNLNLTETENAGMRELRELLQGVAEKQQQAIQRGEAKTIDIAAQRIEEHD